VEHVRPARAADNEGWAIFETNVGLQIERCDDADVFADADEAVAHVKKLAEEGSDIHKRALLINARTNPKEA